MEGGALRVGLEVRAPKSDLGVQAMRCYANEDVLKVLGKVGVIAHCLPDSVVVDYGTTSFAFDYSVFPREVERCCYEGCTLSATLGTAFLCGACSNPYPSSASCMECLAHAYKVCAFCRGITTPITTGVYVIKGPTYCLTNLTTEPCNPGAVAEVVAGSPSVALRWLRNGVGKGGDLDTVDYPERPEHCQDFIPLQPGREELELEEIRTVGLGKVYNLRHVLPTGKPRSSGVGNVENGTSQETATADAMSLRCLNYHPELGHHVLQCVPHCFAYGDEGKSATCTAHNTASVVCGEVFDLRDDCFGRARSVPQTDPGTQTPHSEHNTTSSLSPAASPRRESKRASVCKEEMNGTPPLSINFLFIDAESADSSTYTDRIAAFGILQDTPFGYGDSILGTSYSSYALLSEPASGECYFMSNGGLSRVGIPSLVSGDVVSIKVSLEPAKEGVEQRPARVHFYVNGVLVVPRGGHNSFFTPPPPGWVEATLKPDANVVTTIEGSFRFAFSLTQPGMHTVVDPDRWTYDLNRLSAYTNDLETFSGESLFYLTKRRAEYEQILRRWEVDRPLVYPPRCIHDTKGTFTHRIWSDTSQTGRAALSTHGVSVSEDGRTFSVSPEQPQPHEGAPPQSSLLPTYTPILVVDTLHYPGSQATTTTVPKPLAKRAPVSEITWHIDELPPGAEGCLLFGILEEVEGMQLYRRHLGAGTESLCLACTNRGTVITFSEAPFKPLTFPKLRKGDTATVKLQDGEVFFKVNDVVVSEDFATLHPCRFAMSSTVRGSKVSIVRSTPECETQSLPRRTATWKDCKADMGYVVEEPLTAPLASHPFSFVDSDQRNTIKVSHNGSRATSSDTGSSTMLTTTLLSIGPNLGWAADDSVEIRYSVISKGGYVLFGLVENAVPLFYRDKTIGVEGFEGCGVLVNTEDRNFVIQNGVCELLQGFTLAAGDVVGVKVLLHSGELSFSLNGNEVVMQTRLVVEGAQRFAVSLNDEGSAVEILPPRTTDVTIVMPLTQKLSTGTISDGDDVVHIDDDVATFATLCDDDTADEAFSTISTDTTRYAGILKVGNEVRTPTLSYALMYMHTGFKAAARRVLGRVGVVEHLSPRSVSLNYGSDNLPFAYSAFPSSQRRVCPHDACALLPGVLKRSGTTRVCSSCLTHLPFGAPLKECRTHSFALCLFCCGATEKIAVGASVCRGPSWMWEGQDGTSYHEGRVVGVEDGFVAVTWLHGEVRVRNGGVPLWLHGFNRLRWEEAGETLQVYRYRVGHGFQDVQLLRNGVGDVDTETERLRCSEQEIVLRDMLTTVPNYVTPLARGAPSPDHSASSTPLSPDLLPLPLEGLAPLGSAVQLIGYTYESRSHILDGVVSTVEATMPCSIVAISTGLYRLGQTAAMNLEVTELTLPEEEAGQPGLSPMLCVGLTEGVTAPPQAPVTVVSGRAEVVSVSPRSLAGFCIVFHGGTALLLANGADEDEDVSTFVEIGSVLRGDVVSVAIREVDVVFRINGAPVAALPINGRRISETGGGVRFCVCLHNLADTVVTVTAKDPIPLSPRLRAVDVTQSLLRADFAAHSTPQWCCKGDTLTRLVQEATIVHDTLNAVLKATLRNPLARVASAKRQMILEGDDSTEFFASIAPNAQSFRVDLAHAQHGVSTLFTDLFFESGSTIVLSTHIALTRAPHLTTTNATQPAASITIGVTKAEFEDYSVLTSAVGHEGFDAAGLRITLAERSEYHAVREGRAVAVPAPESDNDGVAVTVEVTEYGRLRLALNGEVVHSDFVLDTYETPTSPKGTHVANGALPLTTGRYRFAICVCIPEGALPSKQHLAVDVTLNAVTLRTTAEGDLSVFAGDTTTAPIPSSSSLCLTGTPTSPPLGEIMQGRQISLTSSTLSSTLSRNNVHNDPHLETPPMVDLGITCAGRTYSNTSSEGVANPRGVSYVQNYHSQFLNFAGLGGGGQPAHSIGREGVKYAEEDEPMPFVGCIKKGTSFKLYASASDPLWTPAQYLDASCTSTPSNFNILQGKTGVVTTATRRILGVLIADLKGIVVPVEYFFFSPDLERRCFHREACPLIPQTIAATTACSSCRVVLPVDTPIHLCEEHHFRLCGFCYGRPVELKEGMKVLPGPTFKQDKARKQTLREDTHLQGTVEGVNRRGAAVFWRELDEDGEEVSSFLEAAHRGTPAQDVIPMLGGVDYSFLEHDAYLNSLFKVDVAANKLIDAPERAKKAGPDVAQFGGCLRFTSLDESLVKNVDITDEGCRVVSETDLKATVITDEEITVASLTSSVDCSVRLDTLKGDCGIAFGVFSDVPANYHNSPLGADECAHSVVILNTNQGCFVVHNGVGTAWIATPLAGNDVLTCRVDVSGRVWFFVNGVLISALHEYSVVHPFRFAARLMHKGDVLTLIPYNIVAQAPPPLVRQCTVHADKEGSNSALISPICTTEHTIYHGGSPATTYWFAQEAQRSTERGRDILASLVKFKQYARRCSHVSLVHTYVVSLSEKAVVLERCDTTLAEHMVADDIERKALCVQLLEALAYLEQEDVPHACPDPEVNIMVNAGCLKFRYQLVCSEEHSTACVGAWEGVGGGDSTEPVETVRGRDQKGFVEFLSVLFSGPDGGAVWPGAVKELVAFLRAAGAEGCVPPSYTQILAYVGKAF